MDNSSNKKKLTTRETQVSHQQLVFAVSARTYPTNGPAAAMSSAICMTATMRVRPSLEVSTSANKAACASSTYVYMASHRHIVTCGGIHTTPSAPQRRRPHQTSQLTRKCRITKGPPDFPHGNHGSRNDAANAGPPNAMAAALAARLDLYSALLRACSQAGSMHGHKASQWPPHSSHHSPNSGSFSALPAQRDVTTHGHACQLQTHKQAQGGMLCTYIPNLQPIHTQLLYFCLHNNMGSTYHVKDMAYVEPLVW